MSVAHVEVHGMGRQNLVACVALVVLFAGGLVAWSCFNRTKKKRGLVFYVILGIELVAGLIIWNAIHAAPLNDTLQEIYNLMLPFLGGWAIYAYVAGREGEENLQLSITPSVTYCDHRKAALVVQVTLHNTGKSLIQAGKDGCSVMIKRLPDGLEQNGPYPIRDLEELSGSQQTSVAADMQTDILAPYRIEDESKVDSNPYRSYELEPGCEYHEIGLFTVDQGSLLLIEAAFSLPEKEEGQPQKVREFCVFRIPDTASAR